MKTLSKEQVLMLHARLIEATGGSNGIRDEGMLDSYLANPFQSFGGEELYPSVQAKAAQLCFGLVKNHAMIDGNKRFGTHVMLVKETVFYKKAGIMMNVNKTVNGVNISYNAGNGTSKTAAKRKWELTDSLKEQIVQMAKEDAKNGVYMGKKFHNLRQNEVAKVAPNRAALIGKMTKAMNSGNMGDMERIREADRRWLCILFGEPYEAEFQSEGFGSAAHVYDENGDEILTYTGGVGWHEKPSKAETQVHQSLKFAYYDAYHAVRQNMKGMVSEPLDIEGEQVSQSCFDVKA